MINVLAEDLELRDDNPYSIGNIFQFENGDLLLDREPLRVPKSIMDRYYTVVAGDTLGSIAFQAYDNSKLWWVIADVNEIHWPFDLEIGITLIIPDKDKVKLLV